MLNRNYVANVPLCVPPLREQRGISAVLRAFDDKIESNRRLVRLIPELIASSIAEALATESQLVPVASLARFVNGGAYTNRASGFGRMVIRIAELNSGPGGSTVYNDITVPEDKLARPGDLLMSWSGSLDVYRWSRREAIVNQHIFKVIPLDLPAWLVHDRLRSALTIFRGIAKDKATTMGHIQRGHLDSTVVSIPVASAITTLSATLQPMWDRLRTAEREILRLEELRDALLPELLSGRMRVPEAREAVAEAVDVHD